MATTSYDLPPKKLDPIRSVDVGGYGRDRVGGYTVVGSGGAGKITRVSGNISREQAEKAEQALQKAQQKQIEQQIEQQNKIQENLKKQEQARQEKIYSGTIKGQVDRATLNKQEEIIKDMNLKYSKITKDGVTTGFHVQGYGRVDASRPFVEPTITAYDVSPGEYITTRELPSKVQGVPLEEYVITDKEGKVLRRATKDETLFAKEHRGVLEVPKEKTFLTKGYEKIKYPITKGYEKIKYPITSSGIYQSAFGGVQKVGEGISSKIPFLEDWQTQFTSRLDSEELNILKGFEKPLTSKEQFLGSVGTDMYEYVQTKPLNVAGGVIVGGVTGLGLKSLGFGVSAIFGAKAVKYFEKATLGVGLGVSGLYAGKTGYEIYSTPSPEGKGKIVGKTIVDVGTFSVGYNLGRKGFTKGYDFYRTKGMTEVPIKDIIAPEFFKGQTYPAIKKGQTAGELLTEFKTIEGTFKGYTASPSLFAKETLTLKGSSELPGLYSAPMVSPKFLRVSTGSEKFKLFSFKDFLGVGKPTIMRLEFKDLNLVYGVKPKQKRLRSLDKGLKDYFESLKGSGKTLIPFIKTEKEAITAWDTPITKTAGDYFIKFGGRKVPIEEFKVDVIGKINLGKASPKTLELRKVSSSYYNAPTKSFIDPLKLGSFSGKSLSSSSKKYSTSLIKSSSLNYKSPSKSIIPSLSSLRSSLISPPKSPYNSIIPSLSPPRPRSTPPRSPLIFPYEGKRSKGTSIKGFRYKNIIRPSFTGIVLEIQEAPVISPTLGVTPFQIRGLETGFNIPKKKSKKKKKKLK